MDNQNQQIPQTNASAAQPAFDPNVQHPFPTAPVMQGQQEQTLPQAQQVQYQVPVAAPAKDNSVKLGMASLILGLIGFIDCGLPFAIASVICAIIGLKKRRSPLCLFGLVVGCLAVTARVLILAYRITHPEKFWEGVEEARQILEAREAAQSIGFLLFH